MACLVSPARLVSCGPTWCTGHRSGDRIALQSLDGRNQLVLPFPGGLSPANSGRLAVGYIEVPKGSAHVVWDRATGRAATLSLRLKSDPLPFASRTFPSADDQPEVLTVASTDDELVVLDLSAIR